jgi:hypothetical protein
MGLLRPVVTPGVAAFALASLYVLLAIGVTLADGPAVIAAPWDVFIQLDGGWRLINGAVPHADFYNPSGVLNYFLVSLGMRLGYISLEAMDVGAAIFIAASSLWALWIAFTRLPPLEALIFVVFIATLGAATRPLGYDPAVTTYALNYNREGWTLLSLLLLQAFARRATDRRSADILDLFSLGALLCALLYCKVTFFLFGLSAILLALLVQKRWRPLSPALVAGFAALVAFYWSATHIDLVEYLADLRMASAAQSFDERFARLFDDAKTKVLEAGVLDAAWVVLVAWPAWRAQKFTAETARATVILCLICLMTFLTAAANTGERGQLPALFVAGLLLLESRRWAAPVDATRTLSYRAAGAAMLVVLYGGVFVQDIASIAHTAKWRAYRDRDAPASQRIDAVPLADFVIPEDSSWPTHLWLAKDTPGKLNDGLAALRRHVDADTRLFVFAEADPFTFALGLKPARGVPLWWDRHFSYDDEIHPSVETAFAEANMVVIPIVRDTSEGCCHYIVSDLQRFYGDYLAERFEELERTEDWIILGRRRDGSTERHRTRESDLAGLPLRLTTHDVAGEGSG